MNAHPVLPVLLLLSTLTVLASCDVDSRKEKSVTRVQYSGFYNTIIGKISDGSEFEGVAWWDPGAYRGTFCLQTDETVCSGRYSARGSRIITGRFECSDSVTGSYRTERIDEGAFLEPISATGKLSDGRTSTAVFAPRQQGTGETICYQ